MSNCSSRSGSFAIWTLFRAECSLVANAVGGQVLGAWDGSKLIGYALADPGLRDGRPYFHSHMLAVAPEYRNRGIGKMLKLAQREDALARGIELIEWTFDPLEIKNALFQH